LSPKEYVEKIRALFKIDDEQEMISYSGSDSTFFLQMQGPTRATLEICRSAMLLVEANRAAMAQILLRSAFEHMLVTAFLFEAENGPVIAKYHHLRAMNDLGTHAKNSGSREAAARLLDFADFNETPEFNFLGKTSKLISRFALETELGHLYFLLSQPTHPLAAFSHYIDYDDVNNRQRIRRSSIDTDPLFVLAYIFRFTCVVMLVNAKLANDAEMQVRIKDIANSDHFDSELKLKSVKI
jgi:hypothetical protein